MAPCIWKNFFENNWWIHENNRGILWEWRNRIIGEKKRIISSSLVPGIKSLRFVSRNDRFTVNHSIKKWYYYRKEMQRSRHPETEWNIQMLEYVHSCKKQTMTMLLFIVLYSIYSSDLECSNACTCSDSWVFVHVHADMLLIDDCLWECLCPVELATRCLLPIPTIDPLYLY